MRKLVKQYVRIIHWSDRDDCYLGSLPDFSGNCCHGDTPEEVAIHLEEVLELNLEAYIEEGEIIPTPVFELDDLGKPKS